MIESTKVQKTNGMKYISRKINQYQRGFVLFEKITTETSHLKLWSIIFQKKKSL
jgi:hypothetical protein